MWTLTLVVLSSFASFFPIVFECSPVSYAWLRLDGMHKGHCVNYRAFVWSATLIGIALDFWIVLLACFLMSGLQIPLKKKIMVYAMFTVGLITIAVSIARLPYINTLTWTMNPTSK
ncbi:hypothetical protein ONZ43_g2201 [Nemania bipapillata]|uniref:Uncharacterized protein n=1 Tax=Nemania bipapillata TaxID=110536 RepID=A0ACC2J1U2_9PEZI|nr:hypothetical protein ONZ43_g2201 [Nemania bipapillata]